MSKNEDFENMVKSLQQKIYQDEEKTYSKKVIEEYRNPHNFGFIKNPDASGKIKGSCGDTMKIDIKIRDKKIIDARFWTDGCGASIACGNMLSKMIKGKTPKEAKNIKSSDLIRALDTIPKEHEHCAKLAVDTLYICLEKFDELKNMRI